MQLYGRRDHVTKNVNIFYLQAALRSLAPGKLVHVLQANRIGIIEKLLQLHLGALALMTASTATKTSLDKNIWEMVTIL